MHRFFGSHSSSIDKKDINGKSEKPHHVNQVEHPEQLLEKAEMEADQHQGEKEDQVKLNVVAHQDGNQQKSANQNGKFAEMDKKQARKEVQNVEDPAEQKPKTFSEYFLARTSVSLFLPQEI